MYGRTLFLLLISPPWLVGGVPYGMLKVLERVAWCRDDYTSYVADEFGPLPRGLDQYMAPTQVLTEYGNTDTALGTTMGQGRLTNFKFESSQYFPQVDGHTFVYFVSRVSYKHEGRYKLLDNLRLLEQPGTTSFILEFDEDLNGKLRVKYLVEECLCRLREYDLRAPDEAILLGARTLACNSDPITPPRPDFSTCELLDNPGIIKFTSGPYPKFEVVHVRRPTSRLYSYSLEFGWPSQDIVDLVFGVAVLAVKHGGVTLDWMRVQNFVDHVYRGYDYIDAINILPQSDPGTHRIQYMMSADCSCVVRTYRVTAGGVTTTSGPCGTPWQPPSTIVWRPSRDVLVQEYELKRKRQNWDDKAKRWDTFNM